MIEETEISNYVNTELATVHPILLYLNDASDL